MLNYSPYSLPFWLILLSCQITFGQSASPGSLIVNVTTHPLRLQEKQDESVGRATAYWVSPRDISEHGHFANSIMAEIQRVDYQAGAEMVWPEANTRNETLLYVIQGAARLEGEEFSHTIKTGDLLLIPPGHLLKAQGSEESALKILQATWATPSSTEPPEPVLKPELKSLETSPFNFSLEGGEVTITPWYRQKETGLSISGIGGHTSYSGSLMYYPDTIKSRNHLKNSHWARVAISQYGPDGGTPWHVHPNREQAFFILSGRALVEIGDVTREVGPGELIFAPKHVGHGYKVLGQKPFRFLEMEWRHPK